MTITVNTLTSNQRAAASSSFSTASVAPGAGRPVFVFLSSSYTAAEAPIRLTGCGLVWTLKNFVPIAQGDGTYWCLSAWQGVGTPANGPITFTMPHSHSRYAWSVFELPGAHPTAPVVQAPGTSGSSNTSLTVNLSPFADPANNMVIAAIFASTTGTPAVGAGFTQIHTVNYTSGSYYIDLLTEYHLGQDLTADASWAGAGRTAGIALEIAAIGSLTPVPMTITVVPPTYSLTPHGYTIGPISMAITVGGFDTSSPLVDGKTLQAHIYSPSGVYLKTWEDVGVAPNHSWPINNGPGAVQLQVPRAYGAIGEPGEGGSDDMNLGNIVKLMVVDAESGVNGFQLFTGSIQQYSIDRFGGIVSGITLVPRASLMGDVFVRGPVVFTATDPTDMAHWFITNGYMPGVTWDASNPLVGVTFNATFTNMKLGQILDQIRLMAGGRWYWIFNRDNSLKFSNWTSTPTHTLLIGKNVLENVVYNRSEIDVKKRVWVFGVADSTDSAGVFHPGIVAMAQTIDYDPTVLPQDYAFSNTRITAQDLADRIAASLLEYHSQAEISTEFTVMDSNYTEVGFGYDIEALKPGDTVRLLDPTSVFAFPKWGRAGKYAGGAMWGGEWQWQIQRTMVIANIGYDWDRAVVRLESRLPQTDEALIGVADRLLLTAT